MCIALFLAITTSLATPVLAKTPHGPEARATATEAAMTDAERTIPTQGVMAIPLGPQTGPLPADAVPGAGYVGGIPRLGVRSLRETDASLGVSYVFGLRKDGATALPSGMLMGSTWNAAILRAGGIMIGGEARFMAKVAQPLQSRLVAMGHLPPLSASNITVRRR